MAAAAITTTVASAWTGGTNGWASPVGYTELLPGFYTSASPGMANCLTGSGTLRVANRNGTAVLFL